MAAPDAATAAEEEKSGFEKLTDFLGDVFEILTSSDEIDFESLSRRTADSTRRLQEQLLDRGFYDGAIDGDFGPASARALLAYLRENPSQVQDVHYSFLRAMETGLDPDSRRAFEQEFGEDLAAPVEDLLAQNNVSGEFRSTPARGGRLADADNCGTMYCFDPRPHAAGDHETVSFLSHVACFDPRPHAAGDKSESN